MLRRKFRDCLEVVAKFEFLFLARLLSMNQAFFRRNPVWEKVLTTLATSPLLFLSDLLWILSHRLLIAFGVDGHFF